MATYKKRGYKKSIALEVEKRIEDGSATAEVFEKLDSTASKTEEWISKYQIFIIIGVGFIALSVLSYLGYQNYILEPKLNPNEPKKISDEPKMNPNEPKMNPNEPKMNPNEPKNIHRCMYKYNKKNRTISKYI